MEKIGQRYRTVQETLLHGCWFSLICISAVRTHLGTWFPTEPKIVKTPVAG